MTFTLIGNVNYGYFPRQIFRFWICIFLKRTHLYVKTCGGGGGVSPAFAVWVVRGCTDPSSWGCLWEKEGRRAGKRRGGGKGAGGWGLFLDVWVSFSGEEREEHPSRDVTF